MLLFSAAAYAEKPSDEAYDWDQWRRLPVVDGGRYKPLDTLAWETLRVVANRGSFPDPKTDKKLQPTPLYLTMLLEWKGWDKTADSNGRSTMPTAGDYFADHEADRWDKSPIIRLDSPALRRALGFDKDIKLAETPKYVPPEVLGDATYTDLEPAEKGEKTKEIPFLDWAGSLGRRADLTPVEENGVEAIGRLSNYRSHRMGQEWNIVPVSDNEEHPWLSIAELANRRLTDENDPDGQLRDLRDLFHEVREAFLEGTPAEFNKSSATFIAKARQIGARQSFYPEQSRIDIEVTYNHRVPFRWAWIFSLIATLCLLLSMATGFKPFLIGGWLASLVALVAMVIGFVMRVQITEWVAVTNQYESVVFVALGAMVLGMVLELISRQQFVLASAAAVATISLVLADNSPAVLDPEIDALNPVLRSNFWLAVHVMTIMLGYAGFAVGAAIANITLGFYLFGSTNRERIRSLSRFTYQSLQFGVWLLAVGTVTGAIWADSAWGRFWGWDPKEVWALIALLVYLAVLHARYVGWVRQLGLAVLSTVSFSAVMIAWFGVNILDSGLHTYGSSGGTEHQRFVGGMIALQLLYAALGGIAGKARQSTPESAAED